jgi:alanine or glycine:cation symporter, AGCS family
MEQINQFLEIAVGYVWGDWLAYTLLGAGLFFTLSLGLIQVKGFSHAFQVVRGKFDNPSDPGEISHFQALTTALSATVGLGNIAGVAVAISMGGPGAVFWMIVTGLLGMATKFSEVTLALKYRFVDERGIVRGGPMYYIERGLGKKWKPLAMFFSFACIASSFGAANMFQTNQAASILNASFGIPAWSVGLILSILTGVVIIGGIRRIGKVTSFLVPFMGGIYVLGALIVVVLNYQVVPELLVRIVTDAFTGTAAMGGVAGIAVAEVIRQGVRRACFSNEAGLGSAPIAHAAASTKEPAREGAVALLEPFIDTVLICTMTALVILISGAWVLPDLNGVELTAAAFDHAIPGFGRIFIPIAVFLFAYSTLLSWSYYGERAVDYLFGPKGSIPYKIVFCILAFLGSLLSLAPVLNFSDIMLGLMVVPNLIAVIFLFPKLKEEANGYFKKLKAGEFKEYK